MSEHSLSRLKNIEKQQVRACDVIGKRALKTIDRTFGTGYPDWQPGTRELAYHNGHHGRSVGQAAMKLCEQFNLGNTEKSLACTAGYSHDFIQGKPRGASERESAQWLEEQLERERVFPPSLRKMGSLAIIGTEPIFSNGILTGQKASELNYPDETTEIVAKSVACGDLGELYTPEGPYLSHQLFREIQGMPPSGELPVDKLTQFQRGQVTMLENYSYPLRKANTLLATHRPKLSATATISSDNLRKVQ